MSEGKLKRIERGMQRVFAAIVGLVLGLLAGVCFALFVMQAIESVVVATIAGGVIGLALAAAYPRPFRSIGEFALSLVGIEL